MPSLYWKNAVDSTWNNIGNWFDDAAATIAATDIPWVADDYTTTYDLEYATGVSGTVTLDSVIGASYMVTGSCELDVVTASNIYSGHYTGSFTVDSFGTVYGGKFTGPLFRVQGGAQVYGGICLATAMEIDGYSAVGGMFFSGGSLLNAGIIRGGIFVGVDSATLGGDVRGGAFPAAIDGVLYFYDSDGTTAGLWNDTDSWFSDYEAATPAGLTDPPWTVDDSTKTYCLIRANQAEINGCYVYMTAAVGNGFEITGICGIGFTAVFGGYLQLSGFVYSGTFSGYNTALSGFVMDGCSITGDSSVFSGGCYVYGGRVENKGSIHILEAAKIYNGVFTSNLVYAYGAAEVYGGVFKASGMDIEYGVFAPSLYLGTPSTSDVLYGVTLTAGAVEINGERFSGSSENTAGIYQPLLTIPGQDVIGTGLL